ncbi:hypothetical protein FJY68_12955 [candidate division WOR-3 bacterium]|uniref:Uncharacterized protein n=1 Tax=candidate division WOR-3 bacterium TaxID=2052148 RepID=A0A937XG13_UNCW3|nr:hypothetical protein [candidate division WOR-3 bacterium]
MKINEQNCGPILVTLAEERKGADSMFRTYATLRWVATAGIIASQVAITKYAAASASMEVRIIIAATCLALSITLICLSIYFEARLTCDTYRFLLAELAINKITGAPITMYGFHFTRLGGGGFPTGKGLLLRILLAVAASLIIAAPVCALFMLAASLKAAVAAPLASVVGLVVALVALKIYGVIRADVLARLKSDWKSLESSIALALGQNQDDTPPPPPPPPPPLTVPSPSEQPMARWHAALAPVSAMLALVLTMLLTCQTQRISAVTRENSERALAWMGRVVIGDNVTFPKGFPVDFVDDSLKGVAKLASTKYDLNTASSTDSGIALIDSVQVKGAVPALTLFRGLFWRKRGQTGYDSALADLRSAAKPTGNPNDVVLFLARMYAGLTLANAAQIGGTTAARRDSLLRAAVVEYDSALARAGVDIRLGLHVASLRWRVRDLLNEPARNMRDSGAGLVPVLVFGLGMACSLTSIALALIKPTRRRGETAGEKRGHFTK